MIRHLVLLSVVASLLVGGAQADDPKSAPKVAASPTSTAPLAVGTQAPDVAVKLADGTETTLSAVRANQPVVLVFFRGGWCPYCTAHLSDLSGIVDKLTAKGVRILAISPDAPEKLAVSAEKAGALTLLSDSSHAAMTSFGVAFQMDDATLTKYKEYGIELPSWSGNEATLLPVPSVFVLDAAGQVKFAHSEPDYTKRLSADAVMAAVDASLQFERGETPESTATPAP